MMEQHEEVTPEERRAALYRIAARYAQAMLVLDRQPRVAETRTPATLLYIPNEEAIRQHLH